MKSWRTAYPPDEPEFVSSSLDCLSAVLHNLRPTTVLRVSVFPDEYVHVFVTSICNFVNLSDQNTGCMQSNRNLAQQLHDDRPTIVQAKCLQKRARGWKAITVGEGSQFTSVDPLS